ncbi:MAG TPA: hypothetical protein IAB40_01240 [Candidatus Onthocola stercoravium]|nr:hypothetical protein [Candidatus Onthocola stercoravium]
MKIDSVITLENDVNCLLLEKVNYNNDNYFLTVVLDDNEEPSDEYIVLKEIIEDGQNYVMRVTDEKVLAELIKLFTKSFGEKVQNLPDFEDAA